MHASSDIPWHMPTKSLSRTGREQIKFKKPMNQDKVSLIKQKYMLHRKPQNVYSLLVIRKVGRCCSTSTSWEVGLECAYWLLWKTNVTNRCNPQFLSQSSHSPLLVFSGWVDIIWYEISSWSIWSALLVVSPSRILPNPCLLMHCWTDRADDVPGLLSSSQNTRVLPTFFQLPMQSWRRLLWENELQLSQIHFFYATFFWLWLRDNLKNMS